MKKTITKKPQKPMKLDDLLRDLKDSELQTVVGGDMLAYRDRRDVGH